MNVLSVVACATCRLDPGQPIFIAEQSMLAFLLTLTMTMLAVLGLVIFSFARKARRAAEAQPHFKP
jgi:hypothetical protein